MTTNSRVSTVLQTVLFLGVVNAIMSVMQIAIGLYSHSDALFADGMHTMLDLCMDVVTYIACRFANRPPDQHLAYGYKRIETFACLILSLLLVGIGVAVVYESVAVVDVYAAKSEYVIVVAIFTMVMNEWLYRVARSRAEAIHSDILMASASHQRSDALSSLMVLVSAIIDLLVPGWHFDHIAALLIGIFIIKMGLKIAYKGIFELIDGGVEPKVYKNLVKFMLTSPGVCGVHCLRTRKQAGEVCLDAHIITDPFISVSEGHFIGEKLRRRTMKQFSDIVDVVVHIDSEDDTYMHDLDSKLPERHEIEQLTSQLCENENLSCDRIIIHYLNEQLYIDLFINHKASAAAIKRLLNSIQAFWSKKSIDVCLHAYKSLAKKDFD